MSKTLKPFEVLDKVGRAIKALGVNGDVAPGDTGKIKVYVSGEYFGVYDTVRETFVD